MIRSVACLLVMLSMAACSTSKVKPWERGALSKPAMTFGSDSMLDSIEDHIYFSKEATSGGRSFGAGGCGCN